MKKYPTFPTMQCDSGCGECCTVVPCSEAEFVRVNKYASEHGVEPVEQGLRCPFYQHGTCAVYPVRPFICRLFGHVPRMSCCRGYNVNVTIEREMQVTRDLKPPERLLHESIPGFQLSDIKALVESDLERNGQAEKTA